MKDSFDGRFFRSLLENAREVVFVLNGEGRIKYVSPDVEVFLGYKPEEMVGRLVTDFISPEELFRAYRDYRAARSSEDYVPNIFTVVARDGTRQVWEGWGKNLLKDEAVEGFVMYVRPVALNDLEKKIALVRQLNEKTQLQESLRESEEKFRGLVENAVFGVYLLQDGRFVYVNPRFAEMTGYSEEELISCVRPEDVIHPEDLPRARQGLRERLKGLVPKSHYAFRIVTKGGETRQMEVYSSRMKYRGKPAAIVALLDVTEKQHLEERLRRVEKMEAMITLAGGVAHDLNNILGALYGFAELLMLKMGPDHEFKSYVEKIMESSRRGAAIVDDLLTMTRRGVKVEEPVNINTVVIDYLKTLEYERMSLYHPQARVNVQISEEIPVIMGSYVHILKSIMNLVSNAVEAMPKGGTVTVRTYCEKKDHLPAREYVVVEVTDEGEGICEEDLKRIFEPFYTKKVMGRSGTGLGLAVVWTTVSDHGGFIEVESKVGEGTCFRLYFPVAETREGISEREEERVDKGNGESILVVDDVPAHLDLVKQILGEAGYTVETAESGEEALGKVRQKKYDLLLLDMLMEPNMDGLETFLEILKIHPNQKIVLMSGFIETERVKEALRLGASSFLKKPYTRRQLIDAISRAISQKEPL